MFNKSQVKNGILILFILNLLFLIIMTIKPYIVNITNLKMMLMDNNPFSFLILIFLVALQVIISPLPGQALGILSGYLYGVYFGTLYTFIGVLIGVIIVFYISKKFGRFLLKKIVSQKYVQKFDNISDRKKEILLFLFYLLPGLPDDIITFLAGVSNISFKKFIIISILGRMPGLIILNLMGSGFNSMEMMPIIILVSIIVILSFIIFIYKNKIEEYIFNLKQLKRIN